MTRLRTGNRRRLRLLQRGADQPPRELRDWPAYLRRHRRELRGPIRFMDMISNQSFAEKGDEA